LIVVGIAEFLGNPKVIEALSLLDGGSVPTPLRIVVQKRRFGKSTSGFCRRA
jgi:hypothetical protein